MSIGCDSIVDSFSEAFYMCFGNLPEEFISAELIGKPQLPGVEPVGPLIVFCRCIEVVGTEDMFKAFLEPIDAEATLRNDQIKSFLQFIFLQWLIRIQISMFIDCSFPRRRSILTWVMSCFELRFNRVFNCRYLGLLMKHIGVGIASIT